MIYCVVSNGGLLLLMTYCAVCDGIYCVMGNKLCITEVIKTVPLKSSMTKLFSAVMDNCDVGHSGSLYILGMILILDRAFVSEVVIVIKFSCAGCSLVMYVIYNMPTLLYSEVFLLLVL